MVVPLDVCGMVQIRIVYSCQLFSLGSKKGHENAE